MAFSFANPAINTPAQTTTPARNPFGNSLFSTSSAPISSGSAPVRESPFGHNVNDSASPGQGQAEKAENDLKASQQE